MKPTPHLLRLALNPRQRDCESLRIVTRRERRGQVCLFPTLTFPTLHQFNNDLPFTVNSRPPPAPAA